MGKPLISDTQLLAIHGAMLTLRSLEQRPTHDQSSAPGVSQRRAIALLAATLLQLRPVDTLFLDAEDALAAKVLAVAQQGVFAEQSQATLVDAGSIAIDAAAGHALAQCRSTRPGDDAPVTVVLLGDVDGASLDAALQLAGEHVLPLLVLVQSGAVRHAPTFESIPNVEVVRIDAEDAVACCRVMQESLLRTRNRWGSVVLQAVTLPNAIDPVVAIDAHLRRRNLFPTG